MKNKLYALLILVLMFWWLWSFIMYFYVYYTWSLTIKSNVSWYSINLHSDSIKKNYSFNCETTNCSFEDIPPVNFYYVASKDWYNDIAWFFDVNSNIENELKIFFKERIFLDEVELTKKEKIEAILEKNQITKKEKIESILEKKDLLTYFKYFDFDDKWIFVLKETPVSVDLYDYDNNKKLYSFKKVVKKDISIYNIIWDNSILVKVLDKNIIYNLNSWKIYEFELNINIKYVKYSIEKKEYIINTDKWSFIYYKKDNKLEYFYLFEDFVYFNWNIIWLLSNSDNVRINNYWIDVNWEQSLIFYNTLNKSKTKILDLNYIVKSFYKEWFSLYLEDQNNNKQILKNIDKY